MKEKKYIRYGLVGIVGIHTTSVFSAEDGVANKHRRFGEPESIINKVEATNTPLRLSMSRVHLPAEVWQDIENLSNIWRVMVGAKLSPKQYIMAIDTLNISDPSKVHITNSKEYKILTALASTHHIQAAQNGDYETLINNLISEGLLQDDVEFRLTKKIENILKQNTLLRNKIEVGLVENKKDIEFIESDLNKLVAALHVNEVKSKSCSVAAVCVALIAVGVATYVAATINVAAALNVAVQISLAVNVAITIGGEGGSCGVSCHSPGAIGSIEPGMLDQLALIDLFSQQVNMPALYSQAVVEFKRKEARAVLQAVINLGMVNINEQQKNAAFNALDKIVFNSLGLAGAQQ